MGIYINKGSYKRYDLAEIIKNIYAIFVQKATNELEIHLINYPLIGEFILLALNAFEFPRRKTEEEKQLDKDIRKLELWLNEAIGWPPLPPESWLEKLKKWLRRVRITIKKKINIMRIRYVKYFHPQRYKECFAECRKSHEKLRQLKEFIEPQDQ